MFELVPAGVTKGPSAKRLLEGVSLNGPLTRIAVTERVLRVRGFGSPEKKEPAQWSVRALIGGR
jgi:hypothetical protein